MRKSSRIANQFVSKKKVRLSQEKKLEDESKKESEESREQVNL
jgi:hypothetical protein